MKEMIKNTLILLLITLIAGFLLGFVYQNTKGLIAQREADDKKAANMEVFADATDFEAVDVVFDDKMAAEFAENGFEADKINEVSKAVSADKTLLGYVITVTSLEGYGGDIQFTVGIRLDGTVNGISILSISETAGLGMEADKVLKPQFSNKKADLFEYTKTGAVADNQIDAISGATITTNAMVNGVNSCLYYFNQVLEGGNSNE